MILREALPLLRAALPAPPEAEVKDLQVVVVTVVLLVPQALLAHLANGKGL
jgi:hypothetical protein